MPTPPELTHKVRFVEEGTGNVIELTDGFSYDPDTQTNTQYKLSLPISELKRLQYEQDRLAVTYEKTTYILSAPPSRRVFRMPDATEWKPKTVKIGSQTESYLEGEYYPPHRRSSQQNDPNGIEYLGITHFDGTQSNLLEVKLPALAKLRRSRRGTLVEGMEVILTETVNTLGSAPVRHIRRGQLQAYRATSSASAQP